MAYLFDVLPFPYGCRMTDLWKGPWVDDPHDREIAAGHLIRLPGARVVDVESDFLASHLPFHAGGFGGVYADGNAWLFVVQQGPPDVGDALAHESDPFRVMRDSLDRALSFNPGAVPVFEVRWTRDDLVEVYRSQGIPTDRVRSWPVAALLSGLLAECCGVPLVDIVDGYPAGCAFPGTEHACEADVFLDVFARWVARQIQGPGGDGDRDYGWSDEVDPANEDGDDETHVPGAPAQRYDADELATKSLRALKLIAVNEFGYDGDDLAGLDRNTLVDLILNPDQVDQSDVDDEVDAVLTVDDLRSMSVADLRLAAEVIGVRVKPGMSKRQLVALLLRSGGNDVWGQWASAPVPEGHCPRCGHADVLPIMWGLPDRDPGPGVILGGCVVDDEPPALVGCPACGWRDTDPVDPVETDASLLRAFPILGAVRSVAGIPGVIYAHQNGAAWKRLKTTMKPKHYAKLKKEVKRSAEQ